MALIGWGSGSTQPLAWNAIGPSADLAGSVALPFFATASIVVSTSATSTSFAGNRRSRKMMRKNNANPSAMAAGISHAGNRGGAASGAFGRIRASRECFMEKGNSRKTNIPEWDAKRTKEGTLTQVITRSASKPPNCQTRPSFRRGRTADRMRTGIHLCLGHIADRRSHVEPIQIDYRNSRHDGRGFRRLTVGQIIKLKTA